MSEVISKTQALILGRGIGKTARMAKELAIDPKDLQKVLRDKSVRAIGTPKGKVAILRADDPDNGNRPGMNISYDDILPIGENGLREGMLTYKD